MTSSLSVLCVAEMELFLFDIAGDSNLSEEHRLRRDILAKKVLRFRRQKAEKDVLNSAASFACSSCLSRAYVEQISNVAWPKVKYSRPRSHSYPLIKRLNPLPRLIEEDETSEAEKPTLVPKRVPPVQTLNWTDNKLSEEWLYKINTLRFTLTSLESFRDNSSRRSSKTPTWTSGEKQTGLEASHQDSPPACKNASIERLRKAVKEDLNCDPLCVKSEPVSNTDQVRKPDSTYISLISGFTQETSNHTRESEDDANRRTKHSCSKKERNCKPFKCIQMNMFAPRNFLCSSQRNTHRQMSNSSEYIEQIASLGC